MTAEQLPMKHIEQKVMKNDESYYGLNRIACYVYQKRKRSEAGELRRRLPKKARQLSDAHIDNRWPRGPDRDRDCGSHRRGSKGRGGGSRGRDGVGKARGRGRKGSTGRLDSNQSTESKDVTNGSDAQGPINRHCAIKMRFSGRVTASKPMGKAAARRDCGKGNSRKGLQRMSK